MARETLAALAVVVLGAALSAAAAGDTPWYEHYERGVRLVEEGRGAEARLALEKALRLRGEEGLRVATEGVRYVDYLPHLYLAAACHMSGEGETARQHLAAAERSGVAARSRAGARLLAAWRVLLEPEEATPEPAAGANVSAAAARRPRYEVYDRRPPLLTEEEFRRVREQVLARCHLGPSTEHERAPWFFHYELGLELGRHGDSQRALDALVEAANRRPQPQRLARIYGMWFLDYLPYLQIARAHARLGNRECAADALALSERLGEVSAADPELAEVKAMLK